MSDLGREIEALERRGWEALSGPDGATFYEDAMADDGLMVFPGMVMDKATALATIRDVQPWSTFELADVRVAADDNTALVTYRASARRAGQPEYVAVMSSVYVRRGDRWLLMLHQQSPR
jgi:ketosteroid isomerase-like protein